MERKWYLKVDEKTSAIAIFLETSEGNKLRISKYLTEINSAKKELEQIKKELDEAFEIFKQELEQKQKREVSTPEDIWKEMSSMDEEQMCTFFNALNADTRKQVADFVFSHVNMFSGPGPIFAELYNPETGLMERD